MGIDKGSLGVWYAADKLSPVAWREFITRVEALGFATQWYSESSGFEAMALGSYLLGQTSSLGVGSGIANIYARDAVASANGLMTLGAISGERFVLGLGVSHVPLVTNLRGHEYGRPVATMRGYLERMAGAWSGAQPWPIVLAALGPRMLELAAELTRGAIPYNVTPEHTARARTLVGPDPWLVVEQKICLEEDAPRARSLARSELARYMPLPNYRNNWLSLGFTEDDLHDGGSDRFLDAMVAWGDEAAVAARIREHFDAGATQVCIQPVHPAGRTDLGLAMLARLAPPG